MLEANQVLKQWAIYLSRGELKIEFCKFCILILNIQNIICYSNTHIIKPYRSLVHL